MEYDFGNMFADLVFEADSDLRSRLEYQEEALREVGCTDPLFGRWVDALDVSYMLAVFALKDEDFAAMFPTMAHTTERERQGFLTAMEGHFKRCRHCSLKRGYDLEMDARIERACRQNNDFLLQALAEDATDSVVEGEGVSTVLKRARSANQ
jgi:hypothetical protein